ncbi:MAG TPA: hypothetical protein VJH70_02715 [Candidatus Paceibacterota bacterium]
MISPEELKRFCEHSKEVKLEWQRTVTLAENIRNHILACTDKAIQERRKFTDEEFQTISFLYRSYRIHLANLSSALSQFGLEVPEQLCSRYFKV